MESGLLASAVQWSAIESSFFSAVIYSEMRASLTRAAVGSTPSIQIAKISKEEIPKSMDHV
jgi:hypothetical protein